MFYLYQVSVNRLDTWHEKKITYWYQGSFLIEHQLTDLQRDHGSPDRNLNGINWHEVSVKVNQLFDDVYLVETEKISKKI